MLQCKTCTECFHKYGVTQGDNYTLYHCLQTNARYSHSTLAYNEFIYRSCLLKFRPSA